MHLGSRTMRPIGLAALLVALVGLSTLGVVAQDATPIADTTQAARPAHIHAGACPEVGDVVAPLNDLTAPTGTTGDVGTAIAGAAALTGAVAVEYSYTNVPLALDAILAGEHAINVHESADNIGTYIACGDLTGGTVDANGTLAVGLGEVNGSGYTGIAVLSPNVADPATTDVSVFIASGLAEGGV